MVSVTTTRPLERTCRLMSRCSATIVMRRKSSRYIDCDTGNETWRVANRENFLRQALGVFNLSADGHRFFSIFSPANCRSFAPSQARRDPVKLLTKCQYPFSSGEHLLVRWLSNYYTTGS